MFLHQTACQKRTSSHPHLIQIFLAKSIHPLSGFHYAYPMVLLSLLVVHPPLPSPHSKGTTLFKRLISYLHNRFLLGSGDAQSPNTQTSHPGRGANFLILNFMAFLCWFLQVVLSTWDYLKNDLAKSDFNSIVEKSTHLNIHFFSFPLNYPH